MGGGRGGVERVDVYVFFLCRFRVLHSSNKSFSINTKHTIKTLHFLVILCHVSVPCNCQFRTILYILNS